MQVTKSIDYTEYQEEYHAIVARLYGIGWRVTLQYSFQAEIHSIARVFSEIQKIGKPLNLFNLSENQKSDRLFQKYFKCITGIINFPTGDRKVSNTFQVRIFFQVQLIIHLYLFTEYSIIEHQQQMLMPLFLQQKQRRH